MQDLEHRIKELIITKLNLEDMQPEDIDTDAPLFGDGLGLDSIDALELGLAIRQAWGVTLESDSAAAREHFRSVATLAALVRAQQADA